MKALVTGAAGFIGTHLVRALADQGHHVVAVDIAEFSPEMGAMSSVIPVQADIRDSAAMAEAMRGVEVVFHQAAMASVPASFANPDQCMEINSTGSAVVFEQARLAGVRRVVMASTSAVYGDDPTPLKHENLRPAPRSPYAVSKLAMEQLADVYSRQYGLETVALRYFNVYGPGQPAEGGYAAVIPAIRKAAITKQPMNVYGDGEQTRSFIYIGDIVQANMLAMSADIDPADGVIIANLASAEVVSVNTLINTFGQLLGAPVTVVSHPEREGDIKHSAGDTSYALERFGFTAEVQLLDGIRSLLDIQS